MFWKVLNLVVSCTFLLLAVTIMTILLRNDHYRSDFSDYQTALQDLQRDMIKTNQSNFVYLESKANRIAENQDSYQINTTRRIDVLEQRMESLDKRTQNNGSRIINNNSAIANGTPVTPRPKELQE